MNISQLTKQFTKYGLKRSELEKSPFKQFEKWLNETIKTKIKEPTAMSLATVDINNQPSIRTVLLKYFDKNGFVFFTNYNSKKAQQISTNPKVALLFQWLDLERQIKIQGRVEKISTSQSLKYFLSRPKESQIGAWASPQSKKINSREFLISQINSMKNKFSKGDIPLPDFWGGYRVIPSSIEFWQGRDNRLHDRFIYTLNDNDWTIERLAP
ncbi:Pyridoxamine 5'-phosphate oxidase [hydrothermal vent metagenome]|uniref:Pyridoxamine 5'-phosphate oxidase n=1 Tax=hydrothermal vent metagenome TaxID=652676 RepID=A0A1W1CAI0_9ZZZZ